MGLGSGEKSWADCIENDTSYSNSRYSYVLKEVHFGKQRRYGFLVKEILFCKKRWYTLKQKEVHFDNRGDTPW